MTFTNNVWTLVNVDERIFTDEGEDYTKSATMPMPDISLKPSDLARIVIEPEQMNYFQLRDYIEESRRRVVMHHSGLSISILKYLFHSCHLSSSSLALQWLQDRQNEARLHLSGLRL